MQNFRPCRMTLCAWGVKKLILYTGSLYPNTLWPMRPALPLYTLSLCPAAYTLPPCPYTLSLCALPCPLADMPLNLN